MMSTNAEYRPDPELVALFEELMALMNSKLESSTDRMSESLSTENPTRD